MPVPLPIRLSVGTGIPRFALDSCLSAINQLRKVTDLNMKDIDNVLFAIDENDFEYLSNVELDVDYRVYDDNDTIGRFNP